MNDATYILFYITFFVLLGFLVPFVNDEFDSDYTDNSIDAPDETSSLTDSLLNILTFAFWTFGLPWWVNLTLLLIFRLHLIYILATKFLLGGG